MPRRVGNYRLIGDTLKSARRIYGLLLWRHFYGRTQPIRAGKPYPRIKPHSVPSQSEGK